MKVRIHFILSNLDFPQNLERTLDILVSSLEVLIKKFKSVRLVEVRIKSLKIIMSVRVKSPNISYKIKTPPRVVSPTTFSTCSSHDSKPKTPVSIPRLNLNQATPVSKQNSQAQRVALTQRSSEFSTNKTQIYIRSREVSPNSSVIHRRNTPITAPAVSEMSICELKLELKESHKTISKLRAQNFSLTSERDILKEQYNNLLRKFEDAKESMRYLTTTLTDILTCIIHSTTRSSDLILNTKFHLVSNIQNAMFRHIEQIAKTCEEEFSSETNTISNWTHSHSTDTLLATGNFCQFLAQMSHSVEDEVPIVSIREGSLTERAGRDGFNCEIPNELLYDSFVFGSKSSFPSISVKNLPSLSEEITPLTDTKVIFTRKKIDKLDTLDRSPISTFCEVKENISFHIEDTPGVEKATEFRVFGDTTNRTLLPSNFVRNR
jgi:hypothetical protein